MEFYISTINQTDSIINENSISTGEAEEILTGPPLTVNNVAVSGTPSTNDVLQYNGSAWTNTAMHTRNYQYKLPTAHLYTNFGGGNFSVSGFNNLMLQITLLNNNAKVRLHFNFFGATVDAHAQNTLFQIKRAAVNRSDVIINAPSVGYRPGTLAHVTSGAIPTQLMMVVLLIIGKGITSTI